MIHKQNFTHGSTTEFNSFTCGAPQANPGAWVDAALLGVRLTAMKLVAPAPCEKENVVLYHVALDGGYTYFIFCLVKTTSVDAVLSSLK